MKRLGQALRIFSLASLVTLAAVAPACSKKPPAAEATAVQRAEEATESTPASGPEATAAQTVASGPEERGASQTAAGDQRRTPQILEPSAIPDVVARIDGEAITKVELLARAAEARGALAGRGTQPPPPTRAFYRKVLDDLIGNRLLHRDLAAQSKAATAADVAARMQAIRSQFQSDEELDQALAERGFDRALFERDVLESATVQKWVNDELIPSIAVSETDVRAFFDANPERMIEPERVRARHILLRVEPQAPEAEKQSVRSRLEELRARLEGGADFASLARETSDDKPSADRGGDLGWFYRGQMVPPFEQAAFALTPNQVSAVVETRFGFHLIEVLEKRAESKLAFEQVKDRLEGMLKQRQLEERVRTRINELGAQAEIEILL